MAVCNDTVCADIAHQRMTTLAGWTPTSAGLRIFRDSPGILRRLGNPPEGGPQFREQAGTTPKDIGADHAPSDTPVLAREPWHGCPQDRIGIKIDVKLATYTTDRLTEGWMPEQIAGRLRIEPSDEPGVVRVPWLVTMIFGHSRWL